MALGFKSQEMVLLNLTFTAACKAAFANLEMLPLAKVSEDGFDDWPLIWGGHLGPFYGEKPQPMDAFLPAVCQRAGKTT